LISIDAPGEFTWVETIDGATRLPLRLPPALQAGRIEFAMAWPARDPADGTAARNNHDNNRRRNAEDE